MSSKRKALLIIIDAARHDETNAALAASRVPALAGAATATLIAPSCWTLPSMASALTGLYPIEHGMTWQAEGKRCEAPTIADMLSADGRSFRLLSGNHIYAPPTMHLPTNSAGASRWQRFRPAAFLGRALSVTDYGSRSMLREVRQMAARCELPDLLVLHLQETHHPYLAPPRGVDPRARLRYGLGHLAYYLSTSARAWNFAATADERAWQAQRARYRECVAYAIGVVEEVLLQYEKAGALDDTLVTVTADHGEHLGEHGLAGHQASLHEELVRCPCAVIAPGVERGSVLPGQFQHTDLLLTICNFLGVPCAGYSPRWEPRDMLREAGREHAFMGWASWGKSSLAKLQRRNPRYDFAPLNRDLTGIRSERWKYIAASDGTEMLFDLREEPLEAVNRAAEHPEVAAELKATLADWLTTVGDGVSPAGASCAGVEAGAKRIRDRRLRDLGYI
ncbi:MAG: sulfatase [Armatimonadota bacterium]